MRKPSQEGLYAVSGTMRSRRMGFCDRLVGIALVLLLVPQSTPSTVAAHRDEHHGDKHKKKHVRSKGSKGDGDMKGGPLCVPEFPLTDEWLGGDAATSIPLSPGKGGKQTRTLWLFGDTFIARDPGQTTREDSFFLFNTIAHSTCSRNGEWEIEYSWRHNDDGTPATVLVPTDGVGLYWPVAGSPIEGIPYVIVERVNVESGSFSTIGVDVARIANPNEHPDNWKVRYSTLTGIGEETPSSATIVDGDYYYILGYLAQPFGRPRYLSRIALNVIKSFPPNLGDYLEVYTGPETGWQVGGTPFMLMNDFATEMGLQRLPQDCGFITTTLLPIQTGEAEASRRIYVRTASQLEGPWSERRLLNTVPDMDEDYVDGFVDGTVCYAAKLHPQLTSPDSLLYTYVCNIANFFEEGENGDNHISAERLIQPRGQPVSEIPPAIFTAMNVYIPRPVSVSLPTPQNVNGLVAECPWLIEDVEQPDIHK